MKSLSSYGFATILHNLPELTSLGRCDCLPQALTQYYQFIKPSDTSFHHHFNLEEVHCESPVTENDLSVIVEHFPKLSRLKIVYRPEEDEILNSLDECPHLTKLNLLPMLNEVILISGDFYNHSIFSALQDGGRFLTKLELVDCDELNLNSLIMIGDNCRILASLTISCCHFDVDMEQRSRINELCSLQVQKFSLYQFK